MKKIHVLLVTTDIDRAETNVFKGLQNRGIDIHAMCDPDDLHFSELHQSLISVTPLKCKKRIYPPAIAAIRKQFQQHFDIIHVLRKPALSNTIIASRGQPSRIIAYRGIVGNMSFFDPFSWLTFLNPRVERVICVAEAIRQFFLKMRLFSYRLPEKKFVTIYKGHSLDWYRHKTPFDWSEFGIERDALTVGTVASMRPRKGVSVLIEAFNQLPEHPPVHLVLVGEVKDNKIVKAYENSPRKDRIHLTGFRKDATRISGGLDVFVLPSLKREGLGRSLIEAMAQSVPAVVTDVGGSPEVVVHGQCGFIVPPREPETLFRAIAKLLTKPHLRAEFGANARERINRHFNIETTISKTHLLYREVLQADLKSARGGLGR
jgi:glycosyltransferase involved in cell wall biosynthesis